MQKVIKPRVRCDDIYKKAKSEGLDDLLANIIANRVSTHTLNKKIDFKAVIKPHVSNLPSPNLLKDMDKAVDRLKLAIQNKQKIGILTDYDVDGITSHAIINLALKEYFKVPAENIMHFIGHRLKDGYGVSCGLVNKVLANNLPDVIITADCGSSDEVNIAKLKENNIDVIVTDHHAIPLSGVPKSAYCTVNPTQADCGYPTKVIAGCMVSWLVMCALRSGLIEANLLAKDTPKLSGLLDFVSLGTVADAVSLACPVNRAVVRAGLMIMNQLKRPSWQAMQKLLKRIGDDYSNNIFEVDDLGFQIGPRINARSRMTEPFAALDYLLATDATKAYKALEILDKNNQERKSCEKDMLLIAHQQAKSQVAAGRHSLVIFDKSFHMGVQGIVASRLVEKFGRPCVVLSVMDESRISGSARTISSVHIRDALEGVHALNKDVLLSFGGHTGAAGLKIPTERLDDFKNLFEQVIKSMVSLDTLKPEVFTDGALQAGQINFSTINAINNLAPFGRGFEAPVFEGEFEIEHFKYIGEDKTHGFFMLATDDLVTKVTHKFRAVWFQMRSVDDALESFNCGDKVRAVYQISQQVYQGRRSVQIILLSLSNLK
jgi:single-stranded-DNA-specific exonuclease